MTHTANHRQKSDIPARLFAACDALADGLGALPGDERRPAAALTLARLMLLSFLHVRGWLDLRDLAQSLEYDDCSGDAILRRLPPGIITVRSLPCPNTTALHQALALIRDAAWSLDDHTSGCVTPATMGFIFERYVERKRGGVYYTGDDVTAYIASRTIIPRLIDALGPAAIQIVTDLVRQDPLRYIPAALQHGSEQELPSSVAVGIADVAQRHMWDAAAPAICALPGETWRDVIARRRRVGETLAALHKGIVDPADLLTHNLDLMRLMRDLCTIWTHARLDDLDTALAQLSVLDPTCGSGAFLCVAFDLLADLASIVVQRRISEENGAASLARRLRAIVEHNLYGVDVMPEAVEICRMRLWLRLAACVDDQDYLHNLRFNIHAGDALTGVLDQPDNLRRDGAAEQRRPLHWRATFPSVMAAGGFDVVIGNPPYVVRSRLSDDRLLRQYQTSTTGNLYALVIERALDLLRPGGWLGVIVPIASVATDGMAPLQRLYAPLRQWHSHYAVRPGKLFPDVDMNLTITLLHKTTASSERYVSGYRRFRSCERVHLFDTLGYTRLPPPEAIRGALPKLGSALEVRLLQRMLAHGRRLRDYAARDGAVIYYHSGGRYWRKALPEKLSSHYKPLCVAPAVAPIALALLNSQVFYWYWIAFSNCMDVVAREVLEFPVFRLEDADPVPFAGAVDRLITLYHESATTRARRGARIQTSETNIDAARAREVIDAIDRLLAQHYGFDDEELDFVLSYDLKYRLGTRRTPHR
jgi:hypothetical protein